MTSFVLLFVCLGIVVVWLYSDMVALLVTEQQYSMTSSSSSFTSASAPLMESDESEVLSQSQSATKNKTSLKKKIRIAQSLVVKRDSTNATVMGMASGYDLSVYERFVGTLRKTGYKGHIILGVSPDVSQSILDYFNYRNVIPKPLPLVNCSYAPHNKNEQKNDSHVQERNTCVHPYNDIKLRWSRFPLARDWLQDCKTCTGPVLIMDVRDSYFQLDPFAGPGSPDIIDGLQVYEEYKSQTTMHWLTKWPIETCKNIVYHNKPMLCSGTTTGTREAMLQYLEIMYQEMKRWMQDPKCHFPINGDDQSIHNFLYYSGQLPFATAVPMLTGGGIVNTVGVRGSIILQEHADEMKRLYNYEKRQAMAQPFQGATGKRWCGKYEVCDDEGYFIEDDGSRSRVIHQYDRYEQPFERRWMDLNGYFEDPMPNSGRLGNKLTLPSDVRLT